MTRFIRICAAIALVGGGSVGVYAVPALAQQGQQGGGRNAPAVPGDALANLPPALRAAVLSGNPDAISQAIATLSASNPTTAANLANLVVKAAEQIFTTDPKSGIQIAQSAVKTIQAIQVQQQAPVQTQEVITTAARLFINPIALAVAPDATAQLAMSAVNASSTTGNASLATTTAGQAVGLAQTMLASNAAGAIQVVGVAVQSVKQDSVMSKASSQAMEVAVAAARVVVRPEAQGVSNTESVNVVKTALSNMANSSSSQSSSEQGRTTNAILAGKAPQAEAKTENNNNQANNQANGNNNNNNNNNNSENVNFGDNNRRSASGS